jgi:hypothetical protein
MDDFELIMDCEASVPLRLLARDRSAETWAPEEAPKEARRGRKVTAGDRVTLC